MPGTLAEPRVDAVLSRLFAQADRDHEVASSLPEDRATRAARQRLTIRERADVLQDIYMPVSPGVGRLLYALVRVGRPDTVVPGHGFVRVEFPVDDGVEVSCWTGRPPRAQA
jgi:predicted N-formylglutamate amidohydrolase